MKRKRTPLDPETLDALFQFGQAAPSLEAKEELMAGWRVDDETNRMIDRIMLKRLYRQQEALQKARALQESLGRVLEQFKEPPWYPAIFLRQVQTGSHQRVLVQYGNGQRLVSCADDNLRESLRTGDEVYLSGERNQVLARAPEGQAGAGETCLYDRHVGDEFMVVKSRDEEFLVRSAAALEDQPLQPGEQLVWNREALVAYQKIERPMGRRFVLESTPAETFESIGGLDRQIAQIRSTVEMRRQHADVARKFQLPPTGSILLHGPPGTGKTLLAKAMANWAARYSPSGRSVFMNIKPGALHSMWYSESEANYREIFSSARQEVRRNPGVPVILFFDEIDAIGTSRGHSLMRTQDNVLLAFCAELDGLEARSDILVVGATNRRDALDSALVRPGRMGDLELHIPRPNLTAAREVLSKHLPPDIPYARNGHGHDLEATRREMLDATISRIFAPNADNELAVLTLRDGQHRTIRAADLVNGALLANLVRRALERACQREILTGRSGLEWADLEEALCAEFESAAGLLSPRNCREHLDDLPHDIDVVNVEPVHRAGRRAHRYLRTA